MTHQEAYESLVENSKKWFETPTEENLLKARKYGAICSKHFYNVLNNFNKNLKLDVDCWEVPSFTKFKKLILALSDTDGGIEFQDSRKITRIPLHRLSPEYVRTWKIRKINWLIECTKNSIKKNYENIEKDKILLETMENNLKKYLKK